MTDRGGKASGSGVTSTRVAISRAVEYRQGETFCSHAIRPSNFDILIDKGAVDISTLEVEL